MSANSDWEWHASQNWSVIRRGVGLMTRSERWGATAIVALMMLAGLFESSVIALVVPLVYAIIDPDRLADVAIVRDLQAFAGVESFNEVFGLLGGALIALLCLSTVANGAAVYAGAWHDARCRNRLCRSLLERLVDAPYLWLLRQNTSILDRQIYEETVIWRRDFVQSLLTIVQSAIMIGAPVAVAVVMAPFEGVAAFLVVALVGLFVIRLFQRPIGSLSRRSKLARDVSVKNLVQILSGVREIRVSGRAPFFVGIFDRSHRQMNHFGTLVRLLTAMPALIMNFLGQLGFVLTALILWSHDMSGAEIAAVLALVGVVVSRVVPATARLVSNVTTLSSGIPRVRSLLHLMDEMDHAGRVSNGVSPRTPVPDAWRAIHFESVSFRYPNIEAWSLRDVSITLERGRRYGFVGRSGAGKSTLVNLLLDLIQPTEGAIRIDGHALADLSSRDWQRRFGYVPQDVFVWDGTLRENVTFGRSDANDDRVLEALHAARLADFVNSLPDGLDTPVGERGRRLSGGQIQRLAIARALYRQPEVLFLDEATSALDSVTEGEIQSAVDSLARNILVVIVAHRVSTLRNCDRIFVLDHGRIVASGTHPELTDSSELFRSLASLADTRAALVS